MSVTIVLAHGYDLVRQGLRLLLDEQEDFQVVGEAATGQEAVNLVRALQPNVLVIDLMMPALNGLEVTRQVQRDVPATHAVMLSMFSDETDVVEALRSGVFAYVLQRSSPDSLFQAVREANAGRLYLSPPLSDCPIEAYLSQVRRARVNPYETLTPREREVLRLAAQGHTSSDIAGLLFISPRTVETHRANLMRKLSLHNQTELVRYALRRGILPLES